MRAILSAVVLAALFAMPAHAGICIKTGEVPILAKKLSVKPAFSGISNQGITYTVLASEETGYWIIVISDQNKACPLVEGTNFGIASEPKRKAK